ncbi:MAG: metallophosphoesterase [candidate division WOR-3 bacterium]|nr:metallophosphoesterase [candidate division WOR-3 bacterium]
MRGLPKKCLFLLLVAVTAFSYPRHKVTFTYEDESATTVHLVGTMNGWNRTATPFSKKDGKFEATVELRPGEYEYKFLIDGEKWITDPNNELVCPGRYKNSLLIVGSEEEIKEIKGELRERAKLVTKIEELARGKTPFKFAVLGDNRGNPKVYKTLLEKISSLAPNFVVNTGDLITNAGHLYQWDEFIGLSSGYDFPILPVVGNHDVDNPRSEKMYRDIFTLPGEEIYYSFVYSNSQFIALDSEIPGEESKITGEQLEWLEEILQSSSSQNRFVFLHRPLYPDSLIGSHFGNCLDKYPEERDSLLALLKMYKVDIVFVGHEHLFRKSAHDGIIQIITGGAGAPLYAAEEDGGFYHFVLVDVEEEKTEGTLYKLKEENFMVIPIFSLPDGSE